MSPRILYGLLFSVTILGTNAPLHAAEKVPDVATVLTNWEWASAGLSKPTEELRDDWLKRQRDGYSVHALALAVEFHGPVLAKELQSRYTWTRAAKSPKEVQLTAVPRDEVEQLFLKKIRVVLSTKSWLPASVSFVTGTGKQQEALTLHVKKTPPPVRQTTAIAKSLGITPVKSTSLDLPENALLPIKPEVDAILHQWANAMSRYRSIETTFNVYQYDLTHNIERRGKGRLRFERPGQWRVAFEPTKIPKDIPSRRLDPKTNRPFNLKTITAASWDSESDGKRFVQQARKEWVIYPKNVSGNWEQRLLEQMTQRLLGFARTVRHDNLRKDYRWRILKSANGEVWLRATAKTRWAASTGRERTVILDTETWLPKAEKSIDLTGNLEYVRVYSNWSTEPRHPARMVQRQRLRN